MASDSLAIAAMPSHAAAPSVIPIILDQDTHGGAVEILELAIANRPEECRETRKAKAEGERDEQQDAVHRTAPLNRSALATTNSDDPDIAAAAINGVTWPRIASGTAIAL